MVEKMLSDSIRFFKRRLVQGQKLFAFVNCGRAMREIKMRGLCLSNEEFMGTMKVWVMLNSFWVVSMRQMSCWRTCLSVVH
jgi:hypothetical protein